MNTAPTFPITNDVKALCRKLNALHQPVWIPLTPVNGAQVNFCYHNVAQLIKQHGGSILYGRMIHMISPDKASGVGEMTRPGSRSSMLYEAEHHALHVDPVGCARDITPKDEREALILFVPTDEPYNGKAILNLGCYSDGFYEINKDELVRKLYALRGMTAEIVEADYSRDFDWKNIPRASVSSVIWPEQNA